MIAPLLVAIATEFDVSLAVAGQLATVTYMAAAVSAITVGPLSDSIGRRPMALTGLSLLSIGVLASAFAPNLWSLIALRAVTGLGGGMLPSNTVAAVADVISPARRAQAVGGLTAFNTMGSMIGVPLLALAAQWGDWRLPFLMVGSLLTLVTLLSWFWFPRNEGAGFRTFSFFARY